MVSHHGIVRLRRTIRQTVISTAIGASLGAGAVIVVVGAVVAVMDRTPAATRSAERQASQSPPTVEAAPAVGAAQAVSAQAAAPAQPAATPSPATAESTIRENNACNQQTWPYYDAACLTRTVPAAAAGLGQTASLPANTGPVPYFSPSVNTVVGTSPTLARTAEPAATAAPVPIAETTAPAQTAASEQVREVLREPEVAAKPEKPARRSAQRNATKNKRIEPSVPEPDAVPEQTRDYRALRPVYSDGRDLEEDAPREYSARQSYAPDAADRREQPDRAKRKTRERSAADRAPGKKRNKPAAPEEPVEADRGQAEPVEQGDFFGGLFGFRREGWR
jgi:hypothetical protein